MATTNIQIWAHTIVNDSIDKLLDHTNNAFSTTSVANKIAEKIFQQSHTSISKDHITALKNAYNALIKGDFPKKDIEDEFKKLIDNKPASQTSSPLLETLDPQLEKELQHIEANRQTKKTSSITKPTNWSAVRKGLFAFLIISISVFIIFQLGNAHFDLIHPAKMISNITHESFINLGLISGISLGGGLITGIGHYRNEKNKKHP